MWCRMGSFADTLAGLDPGTNYFVRAYATNSAGTGYGVEKTFTTKAMATETVTDIDGNEYQTIQIGDQGLDG